MHRIDLSCGFSLGLQKFWQAPGSPTEIPKLWAWAAIYWKRRTSAQWKFRERPLSHSQDRFWRLTSPERNGNMESIGDASIRSDADRNGTHNKLWEAWIDSVRMYYYFTRVLLDFDILFPCFLFIPMIRTISLLESFMFGQSYLTISRGVLYISAFWASGPSTVCCHWPSSQYFTLKWLWQTSCTLHAKESLHWAQKYLMSQIAHQEVTDHWRFLISYIGQSGTPKYETCGLLRHWCTILSAPLSLTQGVVAKYVSIRARAHPSWRIINVQLAWYLLAFSTEEAYNIDCIAS